MLLLSLLIRRLLVKLAFISVFVVVCVLVINLVFIAFIILLIVVALLLVFRGDLLDFFIVGEGWGLSGLLFVKSLLLLTSNILDNCN